MKTGITFLLMLLLSSNILAQGLTIGWVPYTNPLKLLKIHKPVRQYLQNTLHQQVHIISAKGYKSFLEATLRGDYDIIVISPHFGSIALQEGFIPLLKYRASLSLVFVFTKGTTFHTPEDIRGKTLALPGALGVLPTVGLGWFARNGLKEGRDFKVQVASSHPSAMQAVIVGEADVAITAISIIHQLEADLLKKIEYYEAPIAVPHLFTIANPTLPVEKIEQVKAALTAFEHTPEGKAYFENTGYQGYVPITKQDLEMLNPILPDVRKKLESTH